MTYDEETALRVVRGVVNECSSIYVKPMRRDILCSLLRLVDAQQRDLAVLRQKNECPSLPVELAQCPPQ